MAARATIAALAAVLVVACQRARTDGQAVAASAGPVHKIGFMICNSEAETLRRFGPLTAWLSERLGVRFEAVAIDTVDFLARVDEVEFTHTNSLLYVNMHRLSGVEIVAAERSGELGALARGAIVALAKSGMKSVADLKGKRMVFGPSLGPLSYMSQMDMLLAAGIDPDDDLAFYAIPSGSFKHDKVLYGVLFGRYDAGAVPVDDFRRAVEAGKIDADDFRILGTGPPILYCNFARTQRVDDALASRVAGALAELDDAATARWDGEVVRVARRARVDGYDIVEDAAFDPVRDMARRTNMPPYQKY